MNEALNNAMDRQGIITLSDADIKHLLQQRSALRTKVTNLFEFLEKAMPETTTARQFDEIIEKLTNYECQLKFLDDDIEPFIPTEELEEEYAYVIELNDRIVGHLSMLKIKAQLVNQRVTKLGQVEKEKLHLSKQRNTADTSSIRPHLVRPTQPYVTSRKAGWVGVTSQQL